MKRPRGEVTDKEIASATGVSQQTLWRWKKRGGEKKRNLYECVRIGYICKSKEKYIQKALRDATDLIGIIRAGCDSKHSELAISVAERIARNLSMVLGNGGEK